MNITGVFRRIAVEYDEVEPRMFRHFGRELADAVAIDGCDVIDVASGKGAVALAAAERARRVVALDLAPEMVAELRRPAPPNLEARVGDAEALELPDASFDAAFCVFGIFFLKRPDRALAELRRVLRPDGTAAVAVFGKSDERWDGTRRLMRRRRDERPPMLTPDDVRDGLTAAGFADVRSEETVLDATYDDADHWVRWAHTHGMRAFFEQLSPAAHAKWRVKAYPAMEAAREADGRLHNRITAVFLLARRG